MDIFDLFTGGGGRRGSQPRERKSEDVVHQLAVSLEDLYTGTTKKLSLSRNMPCSACNGAGTKSGKRFECQGCHGSGVQVHIRPLGPGMLQQIQQRCSECQGSGYSTPASDRCPTCKGSCLVAEKKTHEVTIEQGMRSKQRIVLKGEAGCTEPGLQPGDVVLVIAQKEHAVFTRPAASPMDLIMIKPISLKEALCGVHFTIKHLDGRSLIIKSLPGEVIKPNSFKLVHEEGMPIHTRPYIKGNLYIKFEVEFPDSFAPEQVAALQLALPGGGGEENGIMESDEHEECHMKPVEDMNEEFKSRAKIGRSHISNSNAYDSDDEDEMGGRGQRVQCAQQ